MKNICTILSITGSDSTGGSGIQADIETIYSLGGYAVTAITAITVQTSEKILSVENIPSDLVSAQVRASFLENRPKAVKIGLVRDIETVEALSKEVVGCKNIVVDAGFLSSRGEKLVSENVVKAFETHVFPNAKVLILKCQEAEMLLKRRIVSVEDMLTSAKKILESGSQSVLLQGGHSAEGIVTDIFLVRDSNEPLFFTSPDIRGWNYHGVAGTLSSAFATFLAKGETLENAAKKAHEYIRNLIVYSVAFDGANIIRHVHNQTVNGRHAEIYNDLMSLVAEFYDKAKGVSFYAEKLNITPRYLSQITQKTVGKTPKQLIDNYLMKEIEEMLLATSLTVQEAAYRFGFASQAAFCKFFKAQKGISPTEFRNTKNI
ncbi:MAG: bifunctional hydroxymethylpyrimidine kinase/phosphomethylpyrimidine kinase [Bacteroidales bacterium]|nr:bifunctional hydroxymethylpyrimidine kinase/phosphomethylpyrimidine kinase [Bacteroidales bacterium]